jgi:peroxiredoxin
MIELGELEGRHDDFAKRQTRVVVVSLEDRSEAQLTQRELPHLVVVSDAERKLIKAAGVLHAGAGQGGSDTAAPTTILIDKQGQVRGLFRPTRILNRLSPDEVLAAVDAEFSAGK